ncbi:14003_t:CDS:2, partial [Racocetra persica]
DKFEIVPPAIIDKLEFFGPPKGERFLIKGHFVKSLNVMYKIADPYTLNKVDSAINLLKHGDNEVKVFTVHQNHIIRVWNNHLFVQELVETEWFEYLRSQINDNGLITTLFCGESVKNVLEDTLKEYKSDHDPAQKHDHEKKSWDTIETKVEIPSNHFLDDSAYFMECKLLESEDLLIITPIGVFIWTIKSDGGIGLLYYWGLYDGTRFKTPKEGIINNLESILNDDKLKFSNKKLLPSPHFNRIAKMRKQNTWYTENDKRLATINAPNFQDLLDYYINDVLLLEIYGNDLMRALLQESDDELVETFFKKCLRLSEFQIEDANISSSIKLVNIIYSSFPQLSEKSFTFVISLLAHLALIPSYNFKDSLVVNSNASHLQYCDYLRQQNYSSNANSSLNLSVKRQYPLSNDTTTTNANATLSDEFYENLYMFSQLYSSFLAVYFMMTGDLSLISPSVLTEEWILVILLVLFSFSTTIYLMNLFIGLLSLAISEANNKQSFLYLRAVTISEIELFWMLPYQRRKKDWFPDFLNYEASVDEVRKLVSLVHNKNYASSNPPYISSSLIEMINMAIKVDTIEGVGERIDGLEKKINRINDDVKKIMKFDEVEIQFNNFSEDMK